MVQRKGNAPRTGSGSHSGYVALDKVLPTAAISIYMAEKGRGGGQGWDDELCFPSSPAVTTDQTILS